MTIKTITTALLLAVSLIGCAASNVTVGRDFPSQNASKIVKGKTTVNELIALVGQPFIKTPISATEERWHYQYTSSSSQAQSYIITMDVTTSTFQKTLDVIINDGVVTNFTLNQTLNPAAVTVN